MNLIKEIKKHMLKNGLDHSHKEFMYILDFIQLHKDIKKFDKEAAKKLVGYINSDIVNLNFVFYGVIDGTFNFCGTLEGGNYWMDISSRLYELRSSTKKEGKTKD